MKKVLLILTLSFAMVALASCGANEKQVDNIGEFDTVDFDGNKVNQDIFKENDLTMVNMFSSTCNPCMEELPYIAELSAELKDRKIGVLGINIDVDQDGNPDKVSQKEVEKILGDRKMKVVFLDYNLMEKVLTRTDAIPYTFFVDNEGNIIGDEYVGNHTKEEWLEIIDKEAKGL